MRRALLTVVVVLVPAVVAAQSDRPPTGHQLAGLPALGFDSDEGLGYGALLQYYDYGYDGVKPYRYSIQPNIYTTTRGRRDVILFLDAPHLLGRQWRMNAAIAREEQLSTPFFGIGNETIDNPVLATGANKYFYKFGRTVFRANADFQHPLGVPGIRAFIGAGVRNQTVRTVPFDSGTTLLAQQFGRGTLPAQQATFGRLGLVVDTRDNEISTTRGNWSEVLFMHAGKTLGGDEVFTRITGTFRQYSSITSDLVFAQRVVMQTVRGELPVTDFTLIQNSYRDYEGLGGSTTIRGIPRNRFQGKGIAFSNSELRWGAAHFDVLKHSTRLVLSGFVDTGRVWANGLDIATIMDDLHTGYGGGVHFEVGPTFIISGDVGHSNLSTAALYLGLGYLF